MIRSLALAALVALYFTPSAALAFSFGGLNFDPPCNLKLSEKPSETPPEELFEQALAFELKEKWCEAAKLYVEIRRLAPISPIFHQSLYNLIQVLYKKGDYDQAITEAKEYLFWYPARPEAEEVLYLIGLCFYSDRGTPNTDQNWTAKAQLVFAEYLKLYPNGRFAPQAREMLEGSYNELAKKEVNVARFYVERKQWLAGALRAQGMLQRFRSSMHVPEALSLLVKAFIGLDRPKDIEAAVKLMEKLYPAASWTAEARADYEAYLAKKAKEGK